MKQASIYMAFALTAALGMAGEEVGAVDVLGDAQAHGGSERTAEGLSG